MDTFVLLKKPQIQEKQKPYFDHYNVMQCNVLSHVQFFVTLWTSP